MMKQLAAFLLGLALTQPALAGSSTITVTPGTGATYDVITDGSGNFVGEQGICDATAAAHCASVNASGQLGIAGPVTNAGTFAVQLNGTPSLANGNGIVPTQGGSVLSATNGMFDNILQGNAVLSATNGLYANLLQGNAVIASGNPLFTQGTTSTAHIGNVDPNTIGNWGLAASTQNGTTPTNAQLVMGQFNTTPTTITTGNVSPLQLDNAGNLLVNIKAGAGSGGTALADGATFTEGTTSFTPIGGEYVSGGGANCTTGKGCTVQLTIDRMAYVNIGKVGGAATGTAGSAGTGVLTIQGIASMTPLLTNPGTIATWGLAAASQNVAAPTNGLLGLCQFTTSPTTISTTNVSPLQCDNANNLLVKVSNTNSNGSATSANSSPVVIASDQAAVAIKAASASIASGAIASGAVASGAFASGSIASGALASGSMVDLLTVIGTKAAGTAAASSLLAGAVYSSTAPTLTTGQQAAVQVSSRGGLLLGNGYPAGSTPITISGTGTTAATTATLATGASVTTYICGFSIRANATAAATGNATVTGTITGTLNFTQWTAPNASGLGVTEEIFTPCVPASAVNTGIAVVSAAPGTSGVVSVTAWGYTL